MAYDFPSSPTNGQTFTPAGGQTYTWDSAGTKWTVTGTGLSGLPTAATTDVLTGTSTSVAVTPDALAALWEKNTTVLTSAATLNLGEGGYFHCGGTVGITDIDFLPASKDGRRAWVFFDAAGIVITHNASSLRLPGEANITTQIGDTALFVQDAADNVVCLSYTRANPFASVIDVQAGTSTSVAVTPDALAGLWEAGATLAAASTITIPNTGGAYFHVSGSAVTVNAVVWATSKAGRWVWLYFDGAVTLVHGGSLLIPGLQNLVTAQNDRGLFLLDGSGITACLCYIRASDSGIYTPSYSAILNVTSITTFPSQWFRVGNMVTVSGLITIDPAGTGATTFSISLPILSNYTGTEQLNGVFNYFSLSGQSGCINGEMAGHNAEFKVLATSGNASPASFTLTYPVM